ncbi:CAPA peptides-like [Prorops nasuta]|uniref:CAPA peptides-like n=1 Tax=Prorops nasuta TaxID=863751 RepID=UPI0034CD497F
MKDRQMSVVLVILVFATSLNQGQKTKVNERRTSSLVPYPRIGRNSEMTNFPRSDRAAGLVNYPRVGRAGPLTLGINRYHDYDSMGDSDLYGARENDLDGIFDVDYEGKAIIIERFDKPIKTGGWYLPERVRAVKEFHSGPKIDDRLLFSDARNSRNHQEPVTLGYAPRVARDSDHDGQNYP